MYIRVPMHTAGRVTSPVFYDTEEGKILSNESSTMIRIFDAKLQHLQHENTLRLRPPSVPAEEIDEWNAIVYQFNNGACVAALLCVSLCVIVCVVLTNMCVYRCVCVWQCCYVCLSV